MQAFYRQVRLILRLFHKASHRFLVHAELIAAGQTGIAADMGPVLSAPPAQVLELSHGLGRIDALSLTVFQDLFQVGAFFQDAGNKEL